MRGPAGRLGRAFRGLFSPGWPVGFRWMLLAAVVLVFGRARTGNEAVVRLTAYLLALGLHEFLHWLTAVRVFPGMPRKVVMGPLGGPAPVPSYPSAGVVAWSLMPAVVGGGAGMMLMVERPEGFTGHVGTFLVIVSAANVLPFYPLDGHVWCSAVLRRTKVGWRYPGWREYLGIFGGIAIGLTAIRDVLGAGELALVGGISIVIDNVYMLMLRRRGGVAKPHMTGFPSARRVADDDKRRLDEILERVARVGIDAISDEDREFLEEMSQKYRKR